MAAGSADPEMGNRHAIGDVPLSAVDWEAFRVFLTFAAVHSMDSAALALGISAPTVKRRIDQLEASLNAKLFHGQGAGFRLTKYGQFISGILEQANGVLENGGVYGPVWKRPKFSIAVEQGAFDYLVMGFFSKNPEIMNNLNFRVTVPSALEAFQFGDVDISFSPFLAKSEGDRSEPVGESVYQFFCSESYNEQWGLPTLENLETHRLIFPKRAQTKHSNASNIAGIEAKCRSSIRVPNYVDGEKLVRSGVGFGLLNTRFETKGLTRLSDFPSFRLKVYLNSSNALRGHEAGRYFYEKLLAYSTDYFSSSELSS